MARCRRILKASVKVFFLKATIVDNTPLSALQKYRLTLRTVIHVCNALTGALDELPKLLSGETVVPSSGFGSNTSKSTPTSGSEIKGIIIGGGYSPDDAEQIKAACDQIKPLPIFRADTTKKRPDGVSGPPNPEELKRRVMEAFETAKGGDGQWQPGVHLF